MSKFLTLIILLLAMPTFAELTVMDGFSIQKLDLTNGKALKPDGWFYSQQHRSKTSLRWVISKEDTKETDGAYETGVSINLMLGFKEKTGMNSEQLAKKLISQISSYGKIIKQCEPQKIERMVRVCIEKIEKNQSGNSYHVMYTFMWWPSSEMVAYTSSGTKPELWNSYSSIFDTMKEIEVVGDLTDKSAHKKSLLPTAKVSAD